MQEFNEYLHTAFTAHGKVFFFFTLITGPRRSLSFKLSDARVYEPCIRARLGNKVLLATCPARALAAT